MIYEMRTYVLKAGTVPAYLKLYGERAFPVQKEILGRPIAYFYSEIGVLNQVVHIWAYESFEERMERRRKLFQNEVWSAVFPELSSYLLSQESKILFAAPFSPLQ